MWNGSRNSAVPCTTVTLRIFAIAAKPPVSLPTTFSLCVFSFARSIAGGANVMP